MWLIIIEDPHSGEPVVATFPDEHTALKYWRSMPDVVMMPWERWEEHLVEVTEGTESLDQYLAYWLEEWRLAYGSEDDTGHS